MQSCPHNRLTNCKVILSLKKYKLNAKAEYISVIVSCVTLVWQREMLFLDMWNPESVKPAMDVDHGS